jgi:pesticin/yersiniabactin receptor
MLDCHPGAAMRQPTLILSLATCCLSIAAPAFAQQLSGRLGASQGRTATPGLDEILVTANRRSQSLLTVDAGVSILDADRLLTDRLFAVADLERVLPGFAVRSRGNRIYSNVTVRGISSQDAYNPSIQIYVDGIPQADAFLTQELVDIERVEFLRGPQSTLYGRNAFGGVLNIVTRQPRANRATLMVQGGNRGLSGTLAGTGVINDRLFVDVAVRGIRDPGQIEAASGGRNVDRVDVWSGRMRLRFAPDQLPFDAGLFVSRDRTASGEEIYLPDAVIGDRRAPAGVPDPLLDRETLTAGFTFNARIGGATLTSVTSLQDVSVDREIFGSRIPEDVRNATQELRLAFDIRTLSGVLGFFYQDSDFKRTELRSVFPRNEVSQNSLALFGEAQIALGPDLSVTLGARWYQDRASIEYRGLFEFNNEARFSGFLPKASIGWTFAPDSRVYALASRGYRAGGFNRAVRTPADVDPYLPEKATNLELGWRTKGFNGALSFSGAFYRISSTDQQILVGQVPTQVLRNAGEVRSEGVELEMRWQITPSFTLTPVLNHGRSRFTNFVDPFTGEGYTGNRVPYAPDTTLSVGVAQNNIRVGDAAILGISGAIRHSSRTFFNESNSLSQPPVTLLDASVDLRAGEDVALSLFATNIADVTYRTFSFGAAPFAFSNIAAGRIVGISARVTLK